MLRFILYSGGFVVILTFLIFLLDGEFNNQIFAAWDKLRDHQMKLKARYDEKALLCQPARSKENSSLDSRLRELQFLCDLAKIDLCVLLAEEQILKIAFQTSCLNRDD